MSELFTHIRESSAIKAAGTAAAAATMVGCGSSADAQPVPTRTVYATETVEVQPEEPSRFIDPDEPATFATYLVTDPSVKQPAVNHRNVDKTMLQAADSMRQEFDGNLALYSTQSKRVYYEPDQQEVGDAEQACYSTRKIGQIAEELYVMAEEAHGKNTLVSIVLGKVDECETVDSEGNELESSALITPAYTQYNPDGRSPYVVYKSYISEQDDFYSFTTGREVLHEVGHAFGMPHVGKFVCEPSRTEEDVDLLLHSFAEIVEQPECGTVSYDDGSVDEYAGVRSIMGSGVNTITDSDYATSFSTVDRATLFPDIYRIERISTEPYVYDLEYGEHKRNGISIDLPAGHPLRSIAPGYDIDQLTVVAEVGGGSMTNEERGDTPRVCGDDSSCYLSMYATNAGLEHFRIELPSTFRGVHDEDGVWRRVMYLDDMLDIGLVNVLGENALHQGQLQVMSYDEALVFAEAQRRDNEASQQNDSNTKDSN